LLDDKPKQKQRRVPVSFGRRTLWSIDQNGTRTDFFSNSALDTTLSGRQVTVSSGHPFASRKRGSLGDLGGDFYTQKQYVIAKSPVVKLSQKTTITPQIFRNTNYVGPVYSVAPSTFGPTPFPPANDSGNTALDAAGATAVARCKPTNSVADASVFLGETLREGLPHLIGSQFWKERTHAARKAGREYLNFQFGWQPLISDIRKFAYAVQHADAVLAQYERDAGKVVRRRYHFPTQRTITETKVATGSPPWGPNNTDFYATSLGDVIRIRETIQRRWFSGAFTYYLPRGNDYRSKMIRDALEARKLLGTSLTPDTLWNLAPWSWAVDWFSNTGDVISNLTDWSMSGLVMHYGYVMEHTITKDSYSLTKPGLKAPNVSAAPVFFITETKKRRQANPFGFGLNWGGLSPFQLSILAALGISKR